VIALATASTASGQTRKAKADARRGAQPPALLSLWVPAYYYPNGPGLREWDRLIDAAKLVPIVAIVNPASGPGDHVDKNIAAVVARARKGKVKVVAYIGTQYTRKSLEVVKREVDTYLRFYPDIQGIHFDEQSSAAKDAYITDDQGPNPYDRLPSYWAAEVEAVRRANQPATR
jgi:hypothetical protein